MNTIISYLQCILCTIENKIQDWENSIRLKRHVFHVPYPVGSLTQFVVLQAPSGVTIEHRLRNQPECCKVWPKNFKEKIRKYCFK